MHKKEELWVYLPRKVAEDLTEVIRYIGEKLSPCSVSELIEKLNSNTAGDWITALNKYNNITHLGRNLGKEGVRVEDVSQRVKSVEKKFKNNQLLKLGLADKKFDPNQLLALIVLCYSSPNLIGPKLCDALSKGDGAGIAREMIEGSNYINKKEDRTPSWWPNIRLINYALFKNDTRVKLSDVVKNKVIAGAAKNNITVIEIDQPTFIEQDLSSNATGLLSVNNTTSQENNQNNLVIVISKWGQAFNESILHNITSLLTDFRLTFKTFLTKKDVETLEVQSNVSKANNTISCSSIYETSTEPNLNSTLSAIKSANQSNLTMTSSVNTALFDSGTSTGFISNQTIYNGNQTVGFFRPAAPVSTMTPQDAITGPRVALSY